MRWLTDAKHRLQSFSCHIIAKIIVFCLVLDHMLCKAAILLWCALKRPPHHQQISLGLCLGIVRNFSVTLNAEPGDNGFSSHSPAGCNLAKSHLNPCLWKGVYKAAVILCEFWVGFLLNLSIENDCIRAIDLVSLATFLPCVQEMRPWLSVFESDCQRPVKSSISFLL